MCNYPHTPFVYVIGWTDLNCWYLGVKYGRGCHPIDLWTTYFTSSRVVQSVREYAGEPDHYEVLAVGDVDDMQMLEVELIRTMALHQHDRWLNLQCAGSIAFTPAVRASMSASAKTRTLTDAGRQVRRQTSARVNARPEVRKRHSENGTARYADPANRAETAAATKAAFDKDPALAEARRTHMKDVWARRRAGLLPKPKHLR